MFTLSIKTAGAAFTHETNDETNGEPDPGPEVARLLREAADQIDSGYTRGGLYDINGNTVGEWKLS